MLGTGRARVLSLLLGLAAVGMAGCSEGPQFTSAGSRINFGGPQAAGINPTAPGFADGLLGRHATATSQIGPMPRWRKVIDRFAREQRNQQECTSDQAKSCPAAIWNALVAELRKLPLRERVERVNEFFNRIPYVSAAVNWHNVAYWETPYQFLARGGQCEDYAIAKYLALLQSGVSEKNLRFLVVHDNFEGLDHAITVVNVHGTALALDNQMKSVVPISYLQQRYSPYYALNDIAWWPYISSEPTFVTWQAPFIGASFTSSFRIAQY